MALAFIRRASLCTHAHARNPIARPISIFQHHFATSSTSPEVLFAASPEKPNVGIITLNAPSRFNSLTVSMSAELDQVIASIDYSKIGAVVITGAGKAFSAGGDYGFLRERGKDTPARNAHLMRQFYDLYLRVRKIPVPLIAAINGPAVGAGMCFAMAADMRIASTTARLGFTFVHIGLHPGMGSTFFLPKLVGPQIAARMLLTGELLKGNEAKEIGLVLDAVEESKVLSNAVELASKIASNAPIAVRTCVRTLRMNQDIGLEAALQREADTQAQCYGGTDFKEGVEAQVAKRAPVWTEYEDLGWKR